MEEVPKRKETFDTIEAGRLKERLVEAISIIPGTLKDVARVYVLALKSLGTPENEIEKKLKAVTDSMIDRSDKARASADARFEKKIA